MENPTCNSGHSDYPLRLWDCPVCVAKKIALLEDALSDLMKDYARRVRNGVMLKPYLQARRLMEEK